MERIETQLYLDATPHFALHEDNPSSSHLCYTMALLLSPDTAMLQHGGTGDRGPSTSPEHPPNLACAP